MLNHSPKKKSALYGSAINTLYGKLTKTGIPQQITKYIFRNALTIVTYHGVIEQPLPIDDGCFISRDSLIKQLLYIKKNFLVVHLLDAIDMIASKRKPIQPLLSLTFDDGFQSNYDIVFPILKKLRMPATLFPVTGFIDSDQTIWYCTLNMLLSESTRKGFIWEGKKYEMNTRRERSITCLNIKEKLKRKPQNVLVQEIGNISSLLGCQHQMKVREKSPYRILNSRDMKKMDESGLVTFGAHTHTHSILSLLPDHLKEYEVKTSIDYVKAATNKPCGLFSYPNGEKGDFEEKTQGILTENGIQCALSMMRGPNYLDTNPLCFHRYGIEGHMQFSTFLANVHHTIWLKRALSGIGKQMFVG